MPPRYPFQALPPHYGRPYPFLLQPAAATDADGLAPDVPLPADGPERLALSPEDKPIRLSPSKIPEPLREDPAGEALAEREVKAEVEDVDEGREELPSLESPLALRAEEAMAAPSPGGGLLEAQALGTGGQGAMESSGCPDFAEGAETRVESPGRTVSHTAAPDLGARLTPETLVEAKEEPVEVPVDVPVGVGMPVAEEGPDLRSGGEAVDCQLLFKPEQRQMDHATVTKKVSRVCQILALMGIIAIYLCNNP